MNEPLIHNENNQNNNISSIYIGLSILCLLSMISFGYTTQYSIKWASGNSNNVNVWINPYKICLQNNISFPLSIQDGINGNNCHETLLIKWKFINSTRICEFYFHYMKPIMASITVIYFLLSVSLFVLYIKKIQNTISNEIFNMFIGNWYFVFIIITLIGSINYSKWIFECKTRWIELESVILVIDQPLLHIIFTYLLPILWTVSGIIIIKYIICLYEYYRERELLTN